MWGPRDRLVLELERQRNGTEVQTGPFGGAPKRSAKTWLQTWPSNADRMRDPWHVDTSECDTFKIELSERPETIHSKFAQKSDEVRMGEVL